MNSSEIIDKVSEDIDGEPLLIGITGGIGSGKSTVAEVFENAGFPVINADKEARILMEKDVNVKSALIQTFGDDIYSNDGTLIPAILSQKVFVHGNSKNLKLLNEIVHPPLLQLLFSQSESLAQDHDMVIMDIALLYETGLDYGFDYIIGVIAQENLRIERVMNRTGLDKKAILLRIASQISQDELQQKADFIIENNGSIEELIESTECILAFLPYMPNTIKSDDDTSDEEMS